MELPNPTDLIGQLFTGDYADRVWVNDLKAFRDRVQVDPVEDEVIRKVKSFLRRAKRASTTKDKKLFTAVESTYSIHRLISHFWSY